MMLKCWQEQASERLTFTEIREDLEVIMSQGEMYVTFNIDEDSNYFLVPSFNSVPSQHEEDDANADEKANEPTVVKTVAHSQQS